MEIDNGDCDDLHALRKRNGLQADADGPRGGRFLPERLPHAPRRRAGRRQQAGYRLPGPRRQYLRAHAHHGGILLRGRRAHEPAGGGRRPVAPGKRLHPAAHHQQSPGATALRPAPELAPGRRHDLHGSAGIPAGLLLPRGMHRRHGADRGAARVALHAEQGAHDGPSRFHTGDRIVGRSGRHDLSHRLRDLAPQVAGHL